jgi:glycosyltransferase involved in cell wall biosynthesis
VAILCDSPDEKWAAMDLVGEMLVQQVDRDHGERFLTIPVAIDIPRIARRTNVPGNVAFNFDRLLGRYVSYAREIVPRRHAYDAFHVVDHSYAHLVHLLPAKRTGVYCHDLDAFRCLFPGNAEDRPRWFKTLQRSVLSGMQRAALVFHSTKVVREQIERAGLIPADRLVHAPYGISEEFTAVDDDSEDVADVFDRLLGKPYILHVGSSIPRKRLDVLFETFARLRELQPQLALVQNGAELTPAQYAHIGALGIQDAFFQPASRLSRRQLATLYRRAAVVLVTSDAEGFGLPVLEALACGAIVFASDIPVFREIGGNAVVYCAVGAPEEWAPRIAACLAQRSPVPPRDIRIRRAAAFSWANHARIIVSAYERLLS